ncbi:hypothetical protein LCGC14_2105140, partial [marine sediment metagenome]
GSIKSFRLSNQCSAGNGMLLQSMASQFGVDVRDYAETAFKAELSPNFSYGCAVFLDADDVLRPDALSILLQACRGVGDDTVYGGLGDDQITAIAGLNQIHGNAGHDTITGGSGNDLIYGHAGRDGIYAGPGNDFVYAGDDDDLVDGQAGDDRIWGEDGDDTLYGGDDDDVLVGGDGNDHLDGGAGRDILWGGTEAWAPQYFDQPADFENPPLFDDAEAWHPTGYVLDPPITPIVVPVPMPSTM